MLKVYFEKNIKLLKKHLFINKYDKVLTKKGRISLKDHYDSNLKHYVHPALSTQIYIICLKSLKQYLKPFLGI